MDIFKCGECGFEAQVENKEHWNYCGQCAALAPHWRDACCGILGLSDISGKLSKAQRLYFKNEYLEAARTAIIILESELKSLGKSKDYGTKLVEDVLGFSFDKKKNEFVKKPKIEINSLSDFGERNEQEGIALLVSGMFKGLRNIIMHNEFHFSAMHSLSTIILCSLLIDIFHNGSVSEERTCVWTKIENKT